MVKLVWNQVGERYYETGVDHGVLYTSSGKGVPWNGLTSVKENPSGGEANGFYLDGFKYLNRLSPEDFSGTIEAYTYPEEFSEADGTALIGEGLVVNQQRRQSFGLSYRTRIGNDIDGADHGYKLHIVYNALATPSEKDHKTDGSEIDPDTFSWDFSTTPIRVSGHPSLAPMSHVTIDSTKTSPTIMFLVEEWLYGVSETLAGTSASLIPLDKLFEWFETKPSILMIIPNYTTGLSQLVPSFTGDLVGDEDTGLYTARYTSRLKQTNIPGFNRLDA